MRISAYRGALFNKKGEGRVSQRAPKKENTRSGMTQVKVFYDEVGNTLTVWFGNPQDEYIAEETGDEVIQMMDKDGKVIGFEKLNFAISKPKRWQVAFETVAA